jgi:ABC-type multidrug transport system ATPase subunit
MTEQLPTLQDLRQSIHSASDALQKQIPTHAKLFKLNIKDLRISVKKTGNPIIKSINASLENGKLIAVLGASGSGKTTFLNYLGGYTRDDLEVSGDFCINGMDFPNLKSLSRISAYVLQQDLFLANLSVEETLTYQARLKLPKGSEITETVANIISLLNLKNSKGSLIGDGIKRGISGGERKRVSIGCELVTDPL